MRRMAWLAALLVLAACESESATGGGTAPTISNLTVDATTIEVGKSQNVTLSFDFTDPDGDVATAHVDVTVDGVAPLGLDSPVQQSAAATVGKAMVIVALGVPKAGPVALHVTLEDAAGNVSNALDATVTAQ